MDTRPGPTPLDREEAAAPAEQTAAAQTRGEKGKRIGLWMLAALVLIALLTLLARPIMQHHDAERLYAPQTLPLATADAKDAAAKAVKAAKSAQQSAAKANAAAVSKPAAP